MPKRLERDRSQSGLHQEGLGGRRAIAGIAVFVLLSMVATAGTWIFAHLAARQNASALLYEGAITQMRIALRGLNEMALTSSSAESMNMVQSGVHNFRAVRDGNAELAAHTAGTWPDLERKIEAFTRGRLNIALDVDAIAGMLAIAEDIDQMGAILVLQANANRHRAAAAEQRTQLVNIAAGALTILAALGFFAFMVRVLTTRKGMQAVIAHFPCGMMVADAEFNVTAFNDEFLRLLDFPPSLVAQSPLRFESLIRFNAERGEYGPGDRDELVRARVGEARTPQTRVYVRNRGNGVVLETRRMPLPEGGFVTLYTDVTERKRAEDVQQRAKVQLEQITDAVPACIAHLDNERRFRFHNKAYLDIFGLKPEQVKDRTLREVFGDEMYETMRPRVDEVLCGHPVRFERTQRDVKGELRDFAEHYFPRYGEDSRKYEVVGFYSLTTDITETKRIDRMKTEFVSTVSHELRTPLTSIRGSLGLLAGGIAGELPEAATKLLDIAKSNCERLIRLINDILDSEKIESGQMRLDLKVADVGLLLAQTLAANEDFAGQQQVRLALRGEGSRRAKVDADRLVQVVTNLLSNAIKFSPPQSTVEVSLSALAGRIRVEIRDSGPGIPDEFRGRIFQKFSQADSSDRRQKGGTGLGLNITKAIVEQLGGTIGFTTQTGVGTTFFFELPEWRDAPAPAAASPAEPGETGISPHVFPKSPMGALPANAQSVI